MNNKKKLYRFNLSFNPQYLFLIIPVAFWYISMFPGIMTPDSFVTIAIARNETELSSLHTVIFSLLIKYSSFSGNLIFLSTLLVLSVNVLALYIIINLFFKNNQKKIRLIVTGVLFFTPFFGPISVTIWKDSVYTPLTIIGLVVLFKATQFNQSHVRTRIFTLSVLVLSVGACFRHEGWLVLATSGVLFWVFSRFFYNYFSNNNIKSIIFVFFIASILSLLIQNSVMSVTKATPTPEYDRTLSVLLDLQYVNANEPELLLPASRALLNQISSGSSLKSASTCSSSGDFFGPGFNAEVAKQNYLKILQVWFDEVQSDSRETLLKSRSCRIKSALPPIFSGAPTNSAWPTIGISQNTFGYSHPKFTNFIYPLGYAWNYLWKINGSFLGWPGLHLLAVFMILFFTNLGSRLRKHLWLQIVSTFIISRFMVLIVTSASQDFRYYYMVYFLSLPLITLYLIEKFKR